MDRKHINRIVIPAALVSDFRRAKQIAEDMAGITLTDGQFCTRMVQWAVKQIIQSDKGE